MSKSKKSQPRPEPKKPSINDPDFADDAASLLYPIVDEITPQHQAKQDKVGDESPHLGMASLFPNEDHIAAGERAHEKALAILRAQKIDVDDADWLKSSLVRIAQEYAAAIEQDTRVTYSDMKKEVARLQSDLVKTMKRLKNLSMAARHALKASVVSNLPKRIGLHPDYISDFYNKGIKLNEACISISSRKNTRVGHSFRFQRCAYSLWKVREQITGKKLSETFVIHEGAFTTHDAAFIHAVMSAIDENVTASQVQEGLRKAAQAKKKEKIEAQDEQLLSL